MESHSVSNFSCSEFNTGGSHIGIAYTFSDGTRGALLADLDEAEKLLEKLDKAVSKAKSKDRDTHYQIW